jgi:cystathionine gamma-synthase
VLRYVDVLVNSLTKYTAHEGDVIAGLAVINPDSRDANQLRPLLAKSVEHLYKRDCDRLAAQIANTEKVLAQIAANTMRVATYLEKDPRVMDVFWSLAPESKDNFLTIARNPLSVGSMISFTVRGSLELFYDRLSLPKGPSFGMKTSLICPFMYLAHYDIVTHDEGRKELYSYGINPDLLRLSVGAESSDSIISALNLALG